MKMKREQLEIKMAQTQLLYGKMNLIRNNKEYPNYDSFTYKRCNFTGTV